MESESLMILYEDNSVEVHYAGGSRLLLSPCGSEFLFEKAIPASPHPMQPAERVRQRTQFAISIYRDQLLHAIDFRNLYSDRPYLPSSIISPERKNVLFADISKAKWPTPHTADGVIRLCHGSVTVSSLDGHACLFLPELQQEFTVEFLCKVSQQLLAPKLPVLEKRSDESVQNCSGRSSQNPALKPTSKQQRTEEREDNLCRDTEKNLQDRRSTPMQKDEIPWSFQNCSSEYCRVTQRMSVFSCPEEWKYALSLAFMFYRSHAGNNSETDEGNKGNGNVGHDTSPSLETSKAITCLPRALPLSCCAPYLHRWNFSDFFQLRKEGSGHYLYSQPIKVVWSEGVIFRFFSGARRIEIYPGDGSVFKSEASFLGKYFTRYCIQEQTRQREETMYSVSGLPPDIPGSLYSVWTIITQAVRVLQHNLENMLSLTHNYTVCCWKMVVGQSIRQLVGHWPISAGALSTCCSMGFLNAELGGSLSPEMGGGRMLPVPLAETVIPNVGRFFAYSDNKVHAVFYDGMILNMAWDFSCHYGKSQRPQDANIGWCKLTSPEGAQHLLQIDQPELYERYITTVVEWCRSVNKDGEMPTDAPQSNPEDNWSVAAELEKIKRFNFLLEYSNIPSKVSAVKKKTSSNTDRRNGPEEVFLDKDISKKNITETLEKTSRVINDIDSLLASSIKRNMIKSSSGNAVPH